MRRSKDFFPMEGRRGGFGAVGLSVRHWGFGEGVITACGEGTVTVAFGEKRCIFSYPWSFGEELAFLEEEKQKWILSVLEGRDAAHYLKVKWGKDGLHYDLIEDTPVYRRIIAEVKEEIEKRVGKGGYMGYCHRAWGVKREVLLEKYGIIWHSPAAMNPDVMFD